VSVAEAGDRTVLAWRRSGLSLVACGLAMVRGIGHVNAPRRPLAGGTVIGLGVAVWALYVWIARRRSTLELGGSPRPARLSDVAPVAISTAFIGVACVVIDLLA
jgi:uncharacterized membrane protein YidH (DUF202 family)